MIADYYTKPLQGSLFKKLRDIIMGLSPFLMEERVEISDKKYPFKKEKMVVGKPSYADVVRQHDVSSNIKKNRRYS
jgi:hypothetical protein